jgi:glycosyltransferase involved in cell wall biosynthesis
MPAPKVSFLLLAYNQEAYVEAAVQGALAQDYPDLDIILSDDCSPDRSFELMKKCADAYRGPHRVRAMQMPRNLGVSRHLQALVEIAEGELLVLAAADDVSASNRTSRVVASWLAAGGGPAVLYSDYRALSLDGRVLAERSPVICKVAPTFAEICRGEVDVHGGSSAITASIYREFPPMSPDVIYEDRVQPFRALLLGGQITYIDEPLVDYRVHGGVSRMPTDPAKAAEFLFKNEQRKLADAKQRLNDLLAKRPGDRKALRACRATVRDQEARLAFARASSRIYEFVLLRMAFTGARINQLLRTYARYRLRRLVAHG